MNASYLSISPANGIFPLNSFHRFRCNAREPTLDKNQSAHLDEENNEFLSSFTEQIAVVTDLCQTVSVKLSVRIARHVA